MDKKYLQLIKRFALLPIKSKAKHAAAVQMIIELSKRDRHLSSGEIGYGKVLVQLIQAYEKEIVKDYFEDISGEVVLEYLLREHKIKQTEAAAIAGISKQNLNDFLKARRGLTKAARVRLASRFNVTPEMFELSREQKLA